MDHCIYCTKAGYASKRLWPDPEITLQSLGISAVQAACRHHCLCWGNQHVQQQLINISIHALLILLVFVPIYTTGKQRIDSGTAEDQHGTRLSLHISCTRPFVPKILAPSAEKHRTGNATSSTKRPRSRNLWSGRISQSCKSCNFLPVLVRSNSIRCRTPMVFNSQAGYL